jgi:signal peptide peptidase SppA
MLTQILQAMNEPLLLEPTFGARLVSVLGRKLVGAKLSGEELHADLGVPMPEDRPQRQRVGRIAVIPIYGVIANRPQSMGTSTQQIATMARTAAADSDISGIIYDVDSPGGTVTGVPEAAQVIRDVAKVKPSISIANGLMASAGYWLGAAVGKGNVWMLGSGEGPGSIGVWTSHEDWSKWFEANGVTITEMSAGKFKTEGAPWAPLTDEAQAFMQARVDEVYKQFLASVAEDRGDTPANVRSGYGEGRVLSPKLAKAANLGDKIGTIEEAADWLASKVAPRRRGNSAELHRSELALDERLSA